MSQHAHTSPDDRCRAFAEVWPVLNEPALDADLAAEARAHLETCAYCQHQRADYERLDLEIYRHLGPSGAPRYRTENIMKDIFEGAAEQLPAVPPVGVAPATVPGNDSSAGSQSYRLGRARPVLSGLAALAAVLVIALLAATLFTHFGPHHQTSNAKQTPGAQATPTLTQVRGSEWSLEDIAMVSRDEGWAVGDAIPPDSVRVDLIKPLLMHYQHGKWSPVVLPINGHLKGISMVSATDGWAVGETDGLGGFILHYDGQTWQQVFSATPGSTWRIQMLSAKEGWVVGVNSILHYDGHTWQEQALPASLKLRTANTLLLDSLSMRSSAEGWAVGSLYPCTGGTACEQGAPAGVILHYIGGQWTMQKIMQGATLYEISMLSTSAGWITGSVATFVPPDEMAINMAPLLLRYTGGQWVTAPQPLNYGSYQYVGGLQAISFSSANDGWAVAYTSGVHPTLLHYNGSAWSKVILPEIKNSSRYDISRLVMLSANEGWAVGGVMEGQDQELSAPGGYHPTITPLLLHYLNGTWSVYQG